MRHYWEKPKVTMLCSFLVLLNLRIYQHFFFGVQNWRNLKQYNINEILITFSFHISFVFFTTRSYLWCYKWLKILGLKIKSNIYGQSPLFTVRGWETYLYFKSKLERFWRSNLSIKLPLLWLTFCVNLNIYFFSVSKVIFVPVH